MKKLDGKGTNAIARITGIKNHIATSVFMYKSENVVRSYGNLNGTRTKNAEDIAFINNIYIKYKKTGLKICVFIKRNIIKRAKIENKKNTK